jgi:hypothetical protein
MFRCVRIYNGALMVYSSDLNPCYSGLKPFHTVLKYIIARYGKKNTRRIYQQAEALVVGEYRWVKLPRPRQQSRPSKILLAKVVRGTMAIPAITNEAMDAATILSNLKNSKKLTTKTKKIRKNKY